MDCALLRPSPKPVLRLAEITSHERYSNQEWSVGEYPQLTNMQGLGTPENRPGQGPRPPRLKGDFWENCSKPPCHRLYLKPIATTHGQTHSGRFWTDEYADSYSLKNSTFDNELGQGWAKY